MIHESDETFARETLSRALAVPRPPRTLSNIDDAIRTARARAARRKAIAVSLSVGLLVLVSAAGLGVVTDLRDADSSGTVVAGTPSVETMPLPSFSWRADDPASLLMQASMVGELTRRDGCLLVLDIPLAWPRGTTGYVLPDGRVAVIGQDGTELASTGDRVRITGGIRHDQPVDPADCPMNRDPFWVQQVNIEP